jgi:hypothetical protein
LLLIVAVIRLASHLSSKLSTMLQSAIVMLTVRQVQPNSSIVTTNVSKESTI